MTISELIADMHVRIRNAKTVKDVTVDVIASKKRLAIA